MSSHAGPRRLALSDSPPPPPPKEKRPPIQIASAVANSVKPLSSKSPVRRKPLPASAFSPTSPAAETTEATSTQQSRQSQEPRSLSVRPQLNGARSLQYPDRAPVQGPYSTPPEQQLEKSGPVRSHSPVLTRQHSKDPSVTRFSTNDTVPRITTDEVAQNPSRGTRKPSRSNGTLAESAVIEEDMGLKPASRPAPLRTDSTSSSRSQSAGDQKKPVTPGSKFTSFFTRKPIHSPSTESAITDASDQGKSPGPSPYPNSPHNSTHSGRSIPPVPNGIKGPTSQTSQDSIEFDFRSWMPPPDSSHLASRCELLEAELREISTELAGSIKREMDLEDMVERLQTEHPSAAVAADRTSDYFSDSGTSSTRPPTSDYNPKDEVERIKREAEQQRAQIKVELSQKWQTEVSSRKALESHLQALGQKLSQSRSDGDTSARSKELEAALEDSKRRLNEERQTKENFEDLLTALRGDLEQHRNERDNLRDEVVPQLKSRIEGLESTISETQKSSYDVARMQHELQTLRDDNAALNSARLMNAQFGSINEEDGGLTSPRNSSLGSKGGPQRTNTFGLGRSNSRAGLNRSNSTANRGQNESPQNLSDQIKAVELQRDALHSTVKYLLRRQQQQIKQFEKRMKIAEAERVQSDSRTSTFSSGPRKGGYEKEVRGLRSEINLLRRRADDALEQKWQCEKGLAGLKMDLDRSKQETESLHKLLQARDNSAPEVLSSTLEHALLQLQQQRERAGRRDSVGSLLTEQHLSDQLEKSAERSEALSSQVKAQLQANSALRNRLKDAITKGECDQLASAEQINVLQSKLRKLEDVITSAQIQSETAVMKHEEELRVIRASHNSHLMRRKSSTLSAHIFTPSTSSPLSPMFSNTNKSPRLDKTSSGPGMALHQSFKTEYLERKVAELEKALSDAEKEMGEVVGRMNTAQIGVAELEAERDEALRRTRKLEADIAAEREKVQKLVR